MLPAVRFPQLGPWEDFASFCSIPFHVPFLVDPQGHEFKCVPKTQLCFFLSALGPFSLIFWASQP